VDMRFWVRLCVSVLFVLSIVLFAVTVNELRLMRLSQQDVVGAQDMVASLYNSSIADDFIYLPFETWSDLNVQLFSAASRWESLVASMIAQMTIMCVCLVFEVAIFLLPHGRRKKGEKSALLAKQGTQRSYRDVGHAGSPSSPGESGTKKPSPMMCEGPLYEPWNQATLDKLSGEDSPPATKITRAIYRYGPIAGKILLRRFGHLLSNQEITEIERILNFGQGKG